MSACARHDGRPRRFCPAAGDVLLRAHVNRRRVEDPRLEASGRRRLLARERKHSRHAQQLADIGAAVRAAGDVRVDGRALAGRKRAERVTGGQVGDVHVAHAPDSPSSGASSALFSFMRPMRIRPLTVPSGTPMSSAISLCV